MLVHLGWYAPRVELVARASLPRVPHRARHSGCPPADGVAGMFTYWKARRFGHGAGIYAPVHKWSPASELPVESERKKLMEAATRKATLGCRFCGTLNRVDLARAEDRPKCGECGRPILLDRPIAVSDQDLERVVRDSDVPVLVDFHADWCGPCKMMAPLLDDLARERMGEALVAKLDTDRNPGMAVRFSIRGIPTLIAFQGGREVAREVGAVPKPRLAELIDRAAAARE
jgi:thioredoxin 2